MNNNLKYWLALNKIHDLGPITIKKLWEHFGLVEAVWKADEASILKIDGLNKKAVKAFLENRDKIDFNAEIDKVLKRDVKVLTLEDDDYPVQLKNIYDPPPVLYFKGDILKKDEKALAIVGTRKASRYGKETAKKLAFEFASMGITIVSGLASGIDTAAHQGALEAKGRTLAVFGCGVDVIFPYENKALAKEIEGSGAVISEFPMGTGTEKGYFPRRNRIISGLSLGVIVVEGHYDSGAMITAKFALDQGREVFAVPGNVGMDQSKGPHWLIKQGAKLVESVEDVLEELKSQIPIYTSPLSSDYRRNSFPSPSLMERGGTNEVSDGVRLVSNLTLEEQKIISSLSLEPKYIDNIAVETGFPTPQVSSLLMMLEIKKVVRQLPGKMFVRPGADM